MDKHRQFKLGHRDKNDNTQRLFVAVEIPEAIRQQVTRMYDRAVSGIRWVKQSQLHLTLSFIGDVPVDTADLLKEKLEDISHRSFEIRIQRLGAFPNVTFPNIIWMGVAPTAEIGELYHKIKNQIGLVLPVVKNENFYPHITIGRVKDRSDKSIPIYFERNQDFATPFFQINEHILFSSHLTPAGAIHSKLHTYRLN